MTATNESQDDSPPAVSAADRLLAREQLAIYAELIDAGDFEGVGRLFADCVIEGPDGTVIAEGAEAVTHMYVSMTKRFGDGTPKTAHVITNEIVEQKSFDELEVRSRFVVFQATEAVPLQPIVVGRYVDTLGRQGNSWRFCRRRMLPELWGDVSDHLLGAVRPAAT